MPNPIRTLVVGVADPDDSDAVYDHARALAGRMGATLHVVHAYTPPTAALAPDPAAALAAADALAPGWTAPELQEFEKALRRRLRAQVAEGLPTHAVSIHVKMGPPATAIARISEEVNADLVLVGGTRHHGITRAILGTTAARVLREVHAPVVVLRATPSTLGARVLLTTDLSNLSTRVCARGIAMSQALGEGGSLSFRCLHVVGIPPADLPPDESGLQASALDELRRFVEGISGPPSSVEPVVRIGVPAAEILAEARAWGADLVVLGTHARAGISRLLLGSVAEGVLRDLECNALVIPPAPAKQS